MSKWRRKALELLPNDKRRIEEADSAGDLWCDLSFYFIDCVENEDEGRVKAIIKYASWCTSATSNHIQQAVYCGFLEDITRNRKYFPLFKDWFTPVEFEKYKGSFMYALIPDMYKILESEFYEK